MPINFGLRFHGHKWFQRSWKYFLLIHFPDEDGKRAPDADRFLTGRGLILRRVDNYGFPNALRMSIGVEEANKDVVTALAEFLG